MKTKLLVLLILFVQCSVANGQAIPPGKYMFAAPAIYSDNDSGLYEWLCEVTQRKESNVIKLKFLISAGPGEFLDLSVSEDGRVRIVNSHISMSEISRRAEGSGRIVAKGEARGKLAVVSGAEYIFFWLKKRSEWYLRPATAREIEDNLLRGLKGVNFNLINDGIKATIENIGEELYYKVGEGYSFADIPHIVEMLENGEIEYKDRKFSLKKRAEEGIKPTQSISTEVIEEDIPIDRLKDAFKDDAHGDKDHHLNKNRALSKEESAADNVTTAKNEQNNLKQGPAPLPETQNSLFNVRSIALSVLVAVFAGVFILRTRRKRKNNDNK